MDMTDSIAPNSDQMDYEDLLVGERTFTVREVRKGPSADQPVEILLEDFPRPWRPAKTMRRVLVAAWGKNAAEYAGKRLVLFGDPTVLWAGKPVGGIRIKALSHIDKPITLALTVTRGKRAPFTIQPLTSPASTTSQLTDAQIAACESIDELRAMWRTASSVQQRQINARVAQLTGEASE